MARNPTPPGRWVRAADLRPIPADATATIGDFRRYPGCRMMLACAACTWSRTYDPERITARLQELRAGGHATRLADVARRVGWNCPACGRVRWSAQLAWPPELTKRDARQIANRYRN